MPSSGIVVVCYSVESRYLRQLSERIGRISLAIEDAGLQPYAHIRDAQEWNILGADFGKEISTVFGVIDRCEFLLLDLTSDANSRRTGLNLEAGYAKGRGLPIAAIWRPPDYPKKIVDSVVRVAYPYSSVNEIRSVAGRAIAELGVAGEPRN